VAGFAAGLILAEAAASAAAGAVGYRIGGGSPIPLAVTAADLAGLWTGLVGAAWWWSRTHGSGSPGRDLGLRLGRWWDLPVGFAVGLACQYGLIPLLYLPFEQFDRHLARQLSGPARQESAAAHSWLAVVALVALLAVGAPLVEELFFRGLLLRSLSAWAGSPVGVLGSAVLFGLAHFQALQLGGLVAFGLVLALLARGLGRLGPGVAAHAAFNLAAVAASVHIR
jgi:membrane protease YdiL (CAAX protease family)